MDENNQNPVNSFVAPETTIAPQTLTALQPPVAMPAQPLPEPVNAEPAPNPPVNAWEPPTPPAPNFMSDPPIVPPTPAFVAPTPAELVSQPVVKVLSPRGIEYAFLTIALFTGAAALGSALISLVNGQTGFDVLAFPAASFVVALPVFAYLFLRLKKAELRDPSLRYEASKRRSTQFTQIVSFVISFFTLIGFIALIFAKMAGQYHGSLGKVALDVVVVLIVAGGLLGYYWHDEHHLG